MEKGIQEIGGENWIPACAGMSRKKRGSFNMRRFYIIGNVMDKKIKFLKIKT